MDKYACVTGADRGVGLALTEELLKRGYTVFAGRYDESWNGLEAFKEQVGDRLKIIKMDISNDDSMKNACEEIINSSACIDLLINNGAILGDIYKKLTENIDFDEIQRVFNTNAVGPLRVIHGLVGHVLKSEQKMIVNISSEAGSITDCWRDSWFAYCMSKSSLNMMSALVHNAIKDQDGKVVVIHPGHVGTYMRGELDISAKITAQESATGILKVVLDQQIKKTERPMYLDYTGKKLEW
jgi:NAD(P)-dependent dehydrogenase (short-subunit alcohol dehydrogenase family)